MSKEREKQDNENYSKNFTRIPNIVFASYSDLSHEAKFLYCTLRFVYWDAKPRFVSLRVLSEQTGYSHGALGNLLPKLNTSGLIHAEIMHETGKDGKKKGKAKYRISIPDIWEKNRKYFEVCPPNGQRQNEFVHQMDKNVHQMDKNVHQMDNVVTPGGQTHSPQTSPQAQPQLPKENKDIYKTSLKTEYIASEVSTVEPVAPNVALPPISSLGYSSEELIEEARRMEEEEIRIATATEKNIEPVTTRNAQSIEQQSLLPVEAPKASSKKKETHTEPLAPKKVPEMPSEDMAWGTKKCLLMFDAWRGHILIGYYKLTQASTCAKGLAEQYTEEDVRRVYQAMSEDAYWQEKGLDICNIANNIHKEVKKIKKRTVKSAAAPIDTEAERERVDMNNKIQLDNLRERQRRKAEALAQGVKNG